MSNKGRYSPPPGMVDPAERYLTRSGSKVSSGEGEFIPETNEQTVSEDQYWHLQGNNMVKYYEYDKYHWEYKVHHVIMMISHALICAFIALDTRFIPYVCSIMYVVLCM